jgi:FkbM family methyltransferase
VKILWHSVAPWAPTGYGQQTGVMAPRIKALGHDLALSCYYGLQGAEMDWNGIRCYPSYSAAYGSDVIVPHALHHFGAEDAGSMEDGASRGMIITLGDVWTFESPLLDQMCLASWVPIDHLGVPDVVASWFKVMGSIPIAMSRFGEQALQQAGYFPQYVPHGVDTAVFRPGDQAQARESAGIPADAFVVAMVANNIGRDGSRKAFSEQIAAFAELRDKHADAFLVLHCDTDQPMGMRLRPFLQRTLPEGSYTYTDIYAYRKGLNPTAVAEIYRAADVLTNCSYGEGFGIPILEAQACGTPVVVTDATAMPELCGAGWKVGYQPMWHDSQGAWAAVPRIGEIVDAYLEAYDHARDPDLKLMAWGFAQDYDADRVVKEHWVPTLDRFEQALEDRRKDLASRPARPARVPEKVREHDGYLWLDRGDQTDDWVAYTDHENWVRPHLEELLPDGGVMLDVGAHVGRWSIRMAAKASMVIAVEANPHTAATLRRHLAMNDVGNVTVIEVAAWDSETRLLLEDPNGRLDGGGTRTLPSANGDDRTVRAARLDRDLGPLVADCGRLDLVKLDVEGADLHALRGMAGLLKQCGPALLIECHDIYGYYTRADLEQTLTDLGYSFEVAASVPSNWQPGVGIIEEVRDADYLVCRPAPVTVAK